MKSKIILFGLIMMLCVGMVTAFTTLSLDGIEFDSNNPDLRGQAFVLYGAENGGLQSATFEIRDLEEALPQGYAISGSGTISSRLTNYRLTYPLQTYGTFYKMQQVCGADCGTYCSSDGCEFFTLLISNAENWCQGILSSDAVGGVVVKDRYQSNYRCLEIIPIGKYAELNEPKTRFTDTFTIQSSGGTESIAITELDTVKQSSNMLIRYEGNLVTFESEPEPENEVAGYFDTFYNEWKLITDLSANERSEYLNPSYIQDTFADCKDGNVYGVSGWNDCMDYTNNKISSLLSTKYYTNSQLTGSQYGGEFVLTPPQGTLYKIPTFTLTIDADFVGIYRPVGEPEILSLEANEFREGDSSYITAKVRNKAEVDASFSFAWDVSNNFNIQTLNDQQFNAGETRTLQFLVTGQTSEGCTDGTAKLTVKDREYPTSQDMDIVNLKVCDANQCSSIGEQRCLGLVVQECVYENGVKVWDSIRSCPSGYNCRVEDGYGVCSGGSEDDPVCGDGICESGEQKDGQFECLSDCPPPKPDNTLLIVGIISGAILLTAIGLRLKKEGYFGGK